MITFEFGGRQYPCFYHEHNCGFPNSPRVVERSVELALAHYWLKQVHNPVEIGAVTPYYWPMRVRDIVDPADKHPLVNYHNSLFDLNNLVGRNVLSISTIEHVGDGKYIFQENKTPLDALAKLSLESMQMLVTFPAGYSGWLDSFVFGGQADEYCQSRFLVREAGDTWVETPRATAWRPYGGRGMDWANCVCVLTKGGIL